MKWPSFTALGRRAVGAAARSLGYDIKRIPPQPSGPPPYYQISASCQIPTLNFLYELFVGRRPDGTFVEIGAFDGETYSNTSCLADAGWTGLYVEPVPDFADLCRSRHRRNPRVSVVTTAVGATDGEAVLTVGGPLSTLNLQLAEEYRHIPWARREFVTRQTWRAPQTTLNRLLSEHHIPPGLDVLSIDVEGAEAQVFAGFDLNRWRPRMMILELADTHSELTATRQADARLFRAISGAGYVTVYKDPINTIVVTDELFETAYGLGREP